MRFRKPKKQNRPRYCTTCGAEIKAGEYVSKAGNCLECALKGVFKERYGRDLLGEEEK